VVQKVLDIEKYAQDEAAIDHSMLKVMESQIIQFKLKAGKKNTKKQLTIFDLVVESM